VTGAAYDRARDVVVRYGGLPLESNTCVPETWEWDGVAWAQATTADDPHPTACDHMKLAYDVDVGHTLLVGGGDDDRNLSTETWAWDGSDWTLLDEDGPVGRAHHGLVHDDANDRTLLYGGYDGDSVFDDFWSWDGTAWTEIDESGPGPRSHHGLAIDPDGQLVLFGGATGPSSFSTVQSDTWMLTDGAWTQLDAEGPSARLSPALGYDPEQGLWVLYGGFGADGSELGDTWTFDGTTWQCRNGC
jgi:hypothetical protein